MVLETRADVDIPFHWLFLPLSLYRSHSALSYHTAAINSFTIEFSCLEALSHAFVMIVVSEIGAVDHI